MKLFVLLFLLSSLVLHAEPGFYTLGSLQGSGAREWNTHGILDNHGEGHGANFDMSSNMFLSDTLQNPGAIALHEDGTLTARWSHKIELTYSYQADFYQPEAVWNDPEGASRTDFDEQYFWGLDFGIYTSNNNPNPTNKLVVILDTEATGTWSGAGTLNLTFNCLVNSTSTLTYLPPKSTETVTETLVNEALPVTFSTTGTCTEGSVHFSWNSLDVWLPPLRDAYYTGDKEVVVKDALREGAIALEGANTNDFVNQEVKDWTYNETDIQGTPLGEGELQAKFAQFYLLDVEAPYGFYVLGNYGSGFGEPQARFNYGGQSITRALASGFAEDGFFDYGEAATFVEAEILSGETLIETLNLPLIKVPVSPWAGSAADFAASPGVAYSRDPLHWPVSLSATEALSDLSFFTGIWGITASANSAFGVNAYSDGSPVTDLLVTQIEFSTPKRTEYLTLTGFHQTSLGIDGLTANGTFSTTPVTAGLTQHVSLLDVIPGARAALGKFGRILSGGVGLTIEGKLTGKADGTYAALPTDTSPAFTSGTLTANADLKATLNTVPRFARGIVNLAISGGGGVIMVIDLAPTPNVSRLDGYANFSLKIKFFRLIDEELETEVGDPPAFSPPLPAGDGPGETPSNQLPAQSDFDLLRNPQKVYAAHSVDHTTLPAPASEIILRNFNPSLEQWESHLIPDSSGNSNIAPTVVPATANTNLALPWIPNLSNGLIVWCQADGATPASSDDYANYMNSTDLVFRHFNHGSSFSIDSTERTLTDNALADFGPELILGTDDGQARLFWVRGNGLDLTGHTTPLQIMTRNWIAYDPAAPASDPSTAFSPETVALSGLPGIHDWKVTAWDNDNAALACVVDIDGDSATESDREIYLVRQIDGTWLTPVRVTDNAVADDCPVLLFETADRLVLSWRQDGQVVGTMDYDTSGVPSVWFNSSSRAAFTWQLAQLHYQKSEDSLVVLWPEDTGVSFTSESLGEATPGTPFPRACHHELGGIVSGLEAAFSRNTEDILQVVAVTENATNASVTTVPTTLPATMCQFNLRLESCTNSNLAFLSTSSTHPTPRTGESISLEIETSGPNPVSYSWSFNGILLDGKTSSTLTLPPLGPDHDGFYTVTATDGTNTISHTFTINSSEIFPDWIARRHPSESVLNHENDDPDGDGFYNKLEYLFNTDPGDPNDYPKIISRLRTQSNSLALDIHLNAKAVDCPYLIEYTSDFITWHDATSLFNPTNTIPGVTRLSFQAPTSDEAGNAWQLFEIGAEPSHKGFYRLRLQ